ELPYIAMLFALSELHRVLRFDGVLRLGLPDLDRAIDAYRNNDASYISVPDDEMALIDGKFVIQMTWYGTNVMMFTAALASELLERAGFRRVVASTYGCTSSR